MIRHIIVAMLLFGSRQLARAASALAPPTQSKHRVRGHNRHQTSSSDTAPTTQPIPPVAPAQNIQKEGVGIPPKTRENPRTQSRSPQTRPPSLSDIADKSKAARQRQAQEVEKTIEKLKGENAHLRKLLAEAKAEKRAGGAEKIAAVENGTAYDRLLAAYDLPRKTAVSTDGWDKVMDVVYSEERDGFCDRFRSKAYTETEKRKIAKAIRSLAQHGSRRRTKIIRRELPATPPDANYSEASHYLRFTWKRDEDRILIFNACKHTSGHAKGLNNIK